MLPIVTTVSKCALLLCVLALFASLGEGMDNDTGYKITEKNKEVEIGLLASLFPDPVVEKGQVTQQQLMETIKEMFKKRQLDSTLPLKILSRIDQLAHEMLATEMVTSGSDDDFAVAELVRKTGVPLWEYCEEMKKKKGSAYEKMKIDQLPFCKFHSEASDEHLKISSDSRFNNLKLITKVRLFFYGWLVKMTHHLDLNGIERTKIYYLTKLSPHSSRRSMPSGKAFQLDLADFLQNDVLAPLRQKILFDLIEHQSWDAILSFCVQMSLRAFLNYAERLRLDYSFQLDHLIIDGLQRSELSAYLHAVTGQLAIEEKTAKQLVEPIREQIFANLPLSDPSTMKSRIDQALMAGLNGLGGSANKAGAHHVLFEFFVRFYLELGNLASPEWLKTLTDTLPIAKLIAKTQAKEKAKEAMKLPSGHLEKLKISKKDDQKDMGQEGSPAVMSPITSPNSSSSSNKRKLHVADEHAAEPGHGDHGEDDAVKGIKTAAEGVQQQNEQH